MVRPATRGSRRDDFASLDIAFACSCGVIRASSARNSFSSCSASSAAASMFLRTIREALLGAVIGQVVRESWSAVKAYLPDLGEFVSKLRDWIACTRQSYVGKEYPAPRSGG